LRLLPCRLGPVALLQGVHPRFLGANGGVNSGLPDHQEGQSHSHDNQQDERGREADRYAAPNVLLVLQAADRVIGLGQHEASFAKFNSPAIDFPVPILIALAAACKC